METNFFEASSSFASACPFGGGQVVRELPPRGTGPAGILENGFHILELDYGVDVGYFFRLVEP